MKTPIPPYFGDNYVFYFLSLFGLMMVTLLSLEWTWRTAWCLREAPARWNSPVTASRVIIIALLVSVLVRITPDVLLLMTWPEMTEAARNQIRLIDRTLDGFSLIPFSVAWIIDYLSGGLVMYQLRRVPPPPTDLYPTWSTVRRPLQIGLGVAAIAFAVVYLQ